MKKVALSLIALLAAGSFAFGENMAPETSATVTTTLAASATVKFGIDLDTKTSGFAHSEDFKLGLTILDASSNKDGTGDVYGSIKIADLAIKGDSEDGTDSSAFGISLGDITAQIVFPNGYFKLNESTDPSIGYGVDGDDDNGGATIAGDDTFYTFSKRYGDTTTEWKIGTIPGFSAFTGNGVEFGYTLPQIVALTVAVASKGDLVKNIGNAYEGSAELSLKAVEKLTLGIKGYYGAGTRDQAVQGAGATVGYDFGLLAPYFNLNTVGAFESHTEAVAAIYALNTETGVNEISNPDDVKAASDVWDDNGAYSADIGTKLALVDGLTGNIAVTYNSDATINGVLTLNLAADKLAGPASGLFGVKVGNVASSVAKDRTTEVFGKVAVKVEMVTLWAKGSFNATGADDSSSIFAKVGADLAAFDLTTIGAEWDSSDLGAAKTLGDQKLGQLFVYAKVAY